MPLLHIFEKLHTLFSKLFDDPAPHLLDPSPNKLTPGLVYEANVIFKEGQPEEFIKISSFFPDNWPEYETLRAISAAHDHKGVAIETQQRGSDKICIYQPIIDSFKIRLIINETKSRTLAAFPIRYKY
jgi:hypothetical protein